jgi:hypothetical protein
MQMCFAEDHPRASESLDEDGSVRADSIDLCFYTPNLDKEVGREILWLSQTACLGYNCSRASFRSRGECVQCR